MFTFQVKVRLKTVKNVAAIKIPLQFCCVKCYLIVAPPIGRRAEFNKVEKHSTLADINYD